MCNRFPKDKRDKYNHSGIYSISIEDKLVYIGRSKNMKNRIMSHMRNIQNPEQEKNRETAAKRGHHKYEVLNQAYENGIPIGFDVVCYCNETELNRMESYFIKTYIPPLNFAIPEEDGKVVEHNDLAEEVSLEDILALDSTKLPSAYQESAF